MQPGSFRRFETRRERREKQREGDRSVKKFGGAGDVGMPVPGHAVVLERAFPCPCERCETCGGTVSLTAVVWVDDWPLNTPESPEEAVTERPEGGPRVRSLHLSLAPTGLEEQKKCSAGCEISPDEWEVIEGAAFLSMCRAYTAFSDELVERARPP